MSRSMAAGWAGVAELLLTGSLFAQNNHQFSDPNVEDHFRSARMGVGGARFRRSWRSS